MDTDTVTVMDTDMEEVLKIDSHTHCLPHIDDGASDTETAIRMLQELSRQRIETAVLTSHYYPSSESIDHFLKTRERMYNRVKKAVDIPRLRLGAEVYLEREMDKENIGKLCIEGTDRLLIELPFLPMSSWVIEEIENMYYISGCKPILAHLTRYLPYFDDGVFRELVSLPEVMVQVNVDSLGNRKARKYVYEWVEQGVPILLGSDCHNMKDRRPNLKKHARRISKPHRGICLAQQANMTAQKLGLL